MPHLIVEYANNLSEEDLNIPVLLKSLCDTAVATGLFPETGLRARAYRANHQYVGTGNPDNSFVHVAMNIGKGRELLERQNAGQRLFDALKEHMAPLMTQQKIALSFEMRELAEVKFNYKNT